MEVPVAAFEGLVARSARELLSSYAGAVHSKVVRTFFLPDMLISANLFGLTLSANF